MSSTFILLGVKNGNQGVWTLPEENYGQFQPQTLNNSDVNLNSRPYTPYNGIYFLLSSWIFPINFKGAADEAFHTWDEDYGRFLFKYPEGITNWSSIAIKQANDHIAGNHFGYDHASKRIKRVNFSLSGDNYSFTGYGGVETQSHLNLVGFDWSNLNAAGSVSYTHLTLPTNREV